MKTLLQQSGWLLVASLLTACDANPAEVKVTFAQPFPGGRADAAGFAARDQGRYALADDTAVHSFSTTGGADIASR